MTPQRKRRLLFVALILAGVGIASGLVLSALNQNINLFFSPTQVARGEAPKQAVFRLGGLVEDGSVQHISGAGNDLRVNFAVSDGAHSVPVYYAGILPDLFREGQGIVALGTYENGQFRAQEVLAKHDENYMPPEVADALDSAQKQAVETMKSDN